MPIRFFCDHCTQMLKIGTSKVGSVVNCPRCQESIVVPPQSAPQAEELYRTLKTKRPPSTELPPEKNTASVPAWNGLEEEMDDVNMPLWMEEAWMSSPADSPESYPISAVTPGLAEEITIHALNKRHKLTITLLNISLVIAFLVGIVFGIIFHSLFFQSNHPHRHPTNENAGTNEVAGTIYYLNENGERRADVEAVVICLPKDRQPTSLFSCQGLRPEDTVNNDTVQQIHEMGGMYERADVNGSFAFSYREGIRYFVLIISAHQRRTEVEMSPSTMQELRRYFRDPELFCASSIKTDEYEWGKPSLRHTFESTD